MIKTNDDKTVNSTQPRTIYHIWVRSFFDSDNDGNGDIAGITQKLDHIASLGVDTLLLSPIFNSPSYHGYDPTDYLAINPTLGNIKDFETLISKAEELGIEVLLDFPINHTSDQHEWFKLSLNGNSKYKDYYIWRNELPSNFGVPWLKDKRPTDVWHTKTQRKGWYYGIFGYPNPDLNFQNPDVVDEIKLAIGYWLNIGVSGFRFDAVRYLLEEGENKQRDTQMNMDLIGEFVSYGKSVNPNAYFLGEVFSDIETALSYVTSTSSNKRVQLDAVYNFEFQGVIRDAFEPITLDGRQNSNFSTEKESIEYLFNKLENSLPKNKDVVLFINNHDIQRFSPKNEFFAKVAHTLLFLNRFSVSVYYGEELRLQSIKENRDEYFRGLMNWSDSTNFGFNKGTSPWLDSPKWFPWITGSEFTPWTEKVAKLQGQYSDENHLSFIKALGLLRKSDSVFSTEFKLHRYLSSPNTLYWEYENKLENRILLINFDSNNHAQVYRDESYRGTYTDILTGQKFSYKRQFNIPPQTILILHKERI